MNITIAGTGYVGLSNAVLLAQHHHVIAYDIDAEKVNLINQKQSPIIDYDLEVYLREKPLHLSATTNKVEAFKHAEFVIVSTPTNYDPDLNYFNTTSVESVIADVISINPNAIMIIKSTVPVGFTNLLERNSIPKISSFHLSF